MPTDQKLRPETETAIKIIRGLCGRITHFPDNLVVETTEYPIGVKFTIKTTKEDHHKLVGKGGAHVRALTLLVSCLFPESEYGYQLVELREPEEGKRDRFMRPVKAETYDPASAVEALREFLESILVDTFELVVSENPNVPDDCPWTIGYDFAIIPTDLDDYDFLRGTGLEPIVPVAAIDTLWRAFGSKEGVAFKVEVRER